MSVNALRPSVKARLERLATEYGSVAFVTWFVLFALVFASFATAILFGIEVDGAGGTASVLGAAYLATKLTTPLRIGATVVLTPVIARLRQRMRRSPREEKPPPSG